MTETTPQHHHRTTFGDAVAPAPPARRGARPINDEVALLLMAKFNFDLEARGELANDRRAARYIVDQAMKPNPSWSLPCGQSLSAIEDRLRRKFRQRRTYLMAAVTNFNLSQQVPSASS
jgi:hypothetical protein